MNKEIKKPRHAPTVATLFVVGLFWLVPITGEAAEEKVLESERKSTKTSTTRLEVPDIVITGTLTPHTEKDSPVEIERITGKMIEQSGATNIRQVLQDVPAIEFRRTAGGFQTFQIQGLNANHTLFLVNGQELIGSIEGATFTRDLLTSPEIESIEIVKGGAAVQYGSDAIGGVINIRTRKATQTSGALIMGQYGRFNTVTTFAAPEFRVGKFGGYFAAGVSGSDGFDLKNQDARTDGDPQFSTKTASGHLDYAISNNSKLTLYSHFTSDLRRSKANATGAIPSIREIKGLNERTQTVLKWDWSPDASSSFSLWAHHQVFQSNSQTTRLDNNNLTALTRFTQELWEPQFQYSRQLSQQHLLTLGGEHDIRRARSQTIQGSATELTESAGWVQDEIAVLPWLDVLLGGRDTTNNEFGGFFSPQTTLLVKPGDFRGRFTYTRGFRTPDLREAGSSFIEAGGVGVVGNPNLEPEKSHSFTANAEYYFERAKLGASLFRHDVNNLIQFVGGSCSTAEAAALSLPSSSCFKSSNVAKSRSQGFELEAGVKQLDWLYAATGYMNLDAPDQNTNAFLFTRSPHALKGRIVVQHAGWDFTTRIRYSSSFGFSDLNSNGVVDPNEKAPGNVQVDMRLSRMLKNGLEIYVGAENITESRINVRSGSVPIPGEHLWFLGMRMAL